MTRPNPQLPDPKLDLVLERIIDIPRESVWIAWTTPEYIKQWFTPAPWSTVDCEIDLRPGGIFRTVMRSPEGQEFPNAGCYLEVITNERLVWTNAVAPGLRPRGAPAAGAAECDLFDFTAVITLEPHRGGTKYSALVMHGDEESCRKHEQMGFHEGWGIALNQLIAVVKKM